MSSDTHVPAPVATLVDAINAGDTDAFVEAFTENGSVDDWGRVLTGPDGVRSWAETDAIGMDAQMTVLSATSEGDTTTVEFSWSSRKFNGTSTAIVTVDGDRVSSFQIPPAH
ncbi:nuclear transport factor 2 family protein [Aeromicrobium alkaliterrae]|uniref:SnoaL-like domain-containing protein n=1 Tax=Aeromicrobium alkaliterrae TaxID=302168 RepID=A0ABN2KBK6_9ACTN